MQGRSRPALVIVLLSLAIGASVFAWLIATRSTAETQEVFDPVEAQPILQQLGPNTTFHTIKVVYRRYGGAANQVPAEEGPQTVRSEGWLTFDDQGAVHTVRAENRANDGTVVSTAVLEGNDLVFRNADGTERGRLSNFAEYMNVGVLRERIAGAAVATYSRIGQETAPSVDLDERTVLVLEARSPDRNVDRPSNVVGFELPYTADLDGVEKIQRQYVLPDEYRGVRSEVVILDDRGVETVIESQVWEVFEVIPSGSAP